MGLFEFIFEMFLEDPFVALFLFVCFACWIWYIIGGGALFSVIEGATIMVIAYLYFHRFHFLAGVAGAVGSLCIYAFLYRIPVVAQLVSIASLLFWGAASWFIVSAITHDLVWRVFITSLVSLLVFRDKRDVIRNANDGDTPWDRLTDLSGF